MLLADENRWELLIFVAVAMMIYIRDSLLLGEFGDNLKLLQSYPEDGQLECILQLGLVLLAKHRESKRITTQQLRRLLNKVKQQR